MLYPVIDSFYLSLTNSNGTIASWVGFRNYANILSDSTFWNAMYNTFYLAFFQMLISIPLGFIVASLINSTKILQRFFKVLFFIPYITPIVATAMVFMFLLDPNQGAVNFLLSKLGLPPSSWLSDPATAKWGVILLGTWSGLGFIIIICLANLQAISPQLYEAAKIDGASDFQQWLYITIPNMRGTFVFFIITGWIGGLQRFTDVFILGGATGSPDGSIQTIVEYIFEHGFQGFNFGVASAATYILFVIILIFTYFNLKASRLKL
ncbi:ABC transporter permease [Alicyclobacillus fastidiosus]|nr:ABC transporter permease [Alicyclobacillus fastidiosus]